MPKQIIHTFTITIKAEPEAYILTTNGPKGVQNISQLLSPGSKVEQCIKLSTLVREQNNISPTILQELGQSLYDTLFSHEIAKAFGQAQGLVGIDNLRLCLQIEPPELAALPWEMMHDGQNWLALQSSVPLIRTFPKLTDRPLRQRLKVKRPLRILFVGASPETLHPLKIEEAYHQIQDRLKDSTDKGWINFKPLLHATWKDLQDELLEDYHVLFFAVHGTPQEIYLDDGEGSKVDGKRGSGDHEPVSAEMLAQSLKDRQTRLVFLAACQTGDLSAGDSFAQKLIEQANLPAVVVMQYEVNDENANLLAAQFFAALAAFEPVDVALAEARKVVVGFLEGVIRDTFAPVLYLQVKDGALFQQDRNWVAIGASVLALVAALAFIIQTAFFQPDRQAITNAQLTAQAESTQRVIAQNTAQAEATARVALGTSIDISDLSSSKLDPEESLLYAVRAINNLAEAGQPVSIQVQIALMQSLAKPLRSIFEGHTGPVNVVRFSPDGRYIVSGSDDNTARVWNVSTRENQHILQGHTAPVTDLDFSPDGRYVATCSEDGTARIWDILSGQEQAILLGHNAPINTIRFSPDGHYVITGSDDGTARVWDAKVHQLHHVLTGQEAVLIVDISQDGRYVVVGSKGTTARIWDIETGQEKYTLSGGPSTSGQDNYPISSVAFSPNSLYVVTGGVSFLGNDRNYSGDAWSPPIQMWTVANGKEAKILAEYRPIRSMSFSPDGRYLVTGGDNRLIMPRETEVVIWNVETGEFKQSLEGHMNSIMDLSFSPNAEYLVTGSEDETARVWRYKEEHDSFIEEFVLRGHKGKVRTVDFSPDGNYIATGGNDSTVRLWTIETGLERQDLVGHNEWVNDISFSPDGTYLATVSDDTTVRLWNIQNGEERVLQGHEDAIANVRFSPDSRYLATISADNTVRLWDVQSGAVSHILVGPNLWATGGYDGFPHYINFSPDGKSIIVGGYDDNTARIWDTTTGMERYILQGHEQVVSQVRFSPNGLYVVTVGSHDATACIWEAGDGQQRVCFTGHDGQITATDFSPDSQYIATAGADKTVQIWKIETGQRIQILKGHVGSITSLSFSPDGHYLITGSTDGTAQIWDVETWSNIHVLSQHENAVYAVSFSPDSYYVVTGGRDKTVRLWDVQTGLEIITLADHKAHISSVSFSPDGNYIAAASGALFTAVDRDYTVRLWHIPSLQEMVTEANYRVRPSLRVLLHPSLTSLTATPLPIANAIATPIPVTPIPTSSTNSISPTGLSRFSGKWKGTVTEIWPEDTDLGNGDHIITNTTFIELIVNDTGEVTSDNNWQGEISTDLKLTMDYQSLSPCEGKSGVDEFHGVIKEETDGYKLSMEALVDDSFCFGEKIVLRYLLTKE
ncbi:MAG: CHAT domain-containing protein [Anaerolineae bacterium]|nr:CHAT domain-containing protein [Anaerolineae bacterium]